MTEQGRFATRYLAFVGCVLLCCAGLVSQAADFTEPELTMRLLAEGVGDLVAGDGTAVLEFGMKTGALDGFDDLDNDPLFGPPGVNTVGFFLSDERRALDVEYRSRKTPNEWTLDIRLLSNPTTPVVLKWGANAGVGYILPDLPYLHLVRDSDGDGTEDEDYDLTVADQITFNTSYYGNGDGSLDLGPRPYRIVYRNQGTLTADITPPEAIAAGAMWSYRAVGDVAYLGPFASGVEEIVHPGDYEVRFESTTARADYYPPNQIVTVVAEETMGDDPAEIDGEYMTVQSSASMTVLDTKYNPEGGTVDVACTFTYTPDVTLTGLTWTFPGTTPPADWEITALSGQDGASGVIDACGRIVTFSGARALPASNPIEFTVTFTFGDQGADPGDVTFEPTVAANTDVGVLTPVVSGGTSSPQTATLDVNGSVVVDSKDCVYIYRYVALGKRSGTGLRPNAFYELGAGVTEDDVEATILAMVGDLSLDVNGSGVVDSKDCVYIYRYVALGKRSGTGLRPNAFYELGAGVTEDDVQTNIEALIPAP